MKREVVRPVVPPPASETLKAVHADVTPKITSQAEGHVLGVIQTDGLMMGTYGY